MKSVVMHVRTLSCGEVVTFRMIPKYDLDLEAVIDRVRESIAPVSTLTAMEGERIVGEQGAVFWEFRLPYRDYEHRKRALLSALGRIERSVEGALRVRRALELLNE